MLTRTKRRAAGTVAALVAYTLLTLAVFRPAPGEVAHTAPAHHGLSADAILLTSALAHVSRTIFHDPGRTFEAPYFHPVPHSLSYSDHMIGQAIVGYPVWLATENPLLEFNLLVLASYALGATATFFLAQTLGLGTAAAGAAGIVFAFTPFRFHSPLWLQVLFTPFMPLALAAWFAFLAHPTAGRWTAWVLCWVLHGLMGMYLALYFGTVMVALVMAGLFGALGPLGRRVRLGLLAGPIAAAALIAPTLFPYALLRGSQGQTRTSGIDTLPSFLLPGAGTITGWIAGLDGRGQFGPGLLVWALAAAGVLILHRVRGRSGALPTILVRRAVMLGFVVTLLLVFVPLRVQQAFPGFDMIRATNRAFFVTLLFLALLVGWGVQWIAAHGRAGRVAAALVLVLLVLDVGRPPRERKHFPSAAELPPAYRWLATLPDDTIVYDQVNGPEPIALAMYLQTFHHKRLPIGYGGFASPGTAFLNHRLFRFPAPEAVSLMRTIGVGYALRHFANEARAEAAATRHSRGVRLEGRFGKDVVFAIEPAPEPNVARDIHPIPRDAWHVAATLAETTVAALTDGDRTTAWGARIPFRSKPSLTIDLGGARRVTGIRCVPLDPGEIGTASARAEVSTDGDTWEALGAAFEPESFETLLRAPTRMRWWEMRFPTEQVRFVRLTNEEAAFWGDTWRIAELDIVAPGREP